MIHFIHYKYRPKTLDHFYILPDIKNKLKILSKYKNINNLIIYGKNGSCKKTLLLCFLNQFFNNSNTIYNTQTIDFTLSNNYNLFYKVSSHHFEFNFIDNPFINKLILFEIIFPLLNNKSIINTQTIIIIFNLHKIHNYFNIIKNITEKYSNIVLLCTSNIYINYSNNFIQLKSNINNYFDLLKISLRIKNDYSLNISNNTIKQYINLSNYDINILFNIYQHIINQNILHSKNNLIKTKIFNFDFISQIKNILLKNDINDFNQIKIIINNILIFKYYNVNTIIDLLISNIFHIIKNKSMFIYDLSTLFINSNLNNLNDDIILFDTIILCIYKYL